MGEHCNCRVEQAKNLCTNRRNCRFGYTFGRDRDLSTSESKNLQNSVAKKRTRIGNEERRRVPRLRIDPRRRKNEEEQVSEDPVTIKIGGVPIVIPDFDLNPSTSQAGDNTKLVEETLRRPESDKKRRRNRFQTKRKNNSRNKNRTTISITATTSTIAENKSSSRQTTRTSPASRPQKTTRTSPASKPQKTTRTSPASKPQKTTRTSPASRPQQTTRTSPASRQQKTTRTSPASRPQKTTRTSPASRPRSTTTTSPATRPVTNNLFTTLTSFDSLQQTVANAASTPVKLSTLFTTLSLTRIPTTTTPVPATTTTRSERPKNHRGRVTKKHRQQTQTPAASTTIFTSNTTERYQNKECPESLEKCVDACVPLQVCMIRLMMIT